jgi:hypothetical protein
LIAHPVKLPVDIGEFDGCDAYYTARIGDAYLHVAQVFGVDLETFRRAND